MHRNTLKHKRLALPILAATVAAVIWLGYQVVTTRAAGLVGDINQDGAVNIYDLSALLAHWNTSDATADLNGDGTVNVFDLSLVLTNWGRTTTPAPTVTPSPSSSATPTSTAWGMFSVPSGPVPNDVCGGASHVKVAVLEFNWSSAEPSDGTYSSAYLNNQITAANNYRSAGCQVVLSFGLHHAPAWVMAKPNADYMDQHGLTYDYDTDLPNFMWNTSTSSGSIRGAAQDYINHVFATMGTNWFAVRLGGGHWGELGYPPCNTGYTNCYWAFDGAAAATNPVPGWKPGNASPNGEAGKFYQWYDGQTLNLQQWLVGAVRSACASCRIQMLYPGYGARAAQISSAISHNLDGSTSNSSDVARAFDHSAQVAALTDANVQVYGTWGDDTRTTGAVYELAGLAAAHVPALSLGYENAGPGSATKAVNFVSNCRAVAATFCGYIRYTDPGKTDFETAIAP